MNKGTFSKHAGLLGALTCFLLIIHLGCSGEYGELKNDRKVGINPAGETANVDIETMNTAGKLPHPSNGTMSGAVLCVITSRKGCKCFLNLCDEIRRIGRDIEADFDGTIELLLLDAEDDAEEFEGISSYLGLSMLPIVALINWDNGDAIVLYKKSGMFNAGIASSELEGWAKTVATDKKEGIAGLNKGEDEFQ